MRNITFGLVLLVVVSISCTPMHVQMDQFRAENSSNLNGLEIGMDKVTVLEIMGEYTRKLSGLDGERVVTNPYRTSMFSIEDGAIEILYYLTDLTGMKQDDGAITDDELTPIVVINGKLAGWGQDYWKDTAAKYEIGIR